MRVAMQLFCLSSLDCRNFGLHPASKLQGYCYRYPPSPKMRPGPPGEPRRVHGMQMVRFPLSRWGPVANKLRARALDEPGPCRGEPAHAAADQPGCQYGGRRAPRLRRRRLPSPPRRPDTAVPAKLSVKECLTLALEHNADYKRSLVAVANSESRLRATNQLHHLSFDTDLAVSHASHTGSGLASTFGPSFTLAQPNGAGFTSNATVPGYNSTQTDGQAGLEYTLPLIRGRGRGSETRAQLIQARIDTDFDPASALRERAGADPDGGPGLLQRGARAGSAQGLEAGGRYRGAGDDGRPASPGCRPRSPRSTSPARNCA